MREQSHHQTSGLTSDPQSSIMFNYYYDTWHSFGFPNQLPHRQQHVPGTIPIGILGMTWFWMSEATKSVCLSGSGILEPENWPIYVLPISKWIKGKEGATIHLGGRILDHYRASVSLWH